MQDQLTNVSWVPNQPATSLGTTLEGLHTDIWTDNPTVRRVAATMYKQSVPADQPQLKKEVLIMARLIRYTVVDPDLVLADKAPQDAILLIGTRMLPGTDDKAFLMDIAPEVAKVLDAHNTKRGSIEYDDKDGKTRTLKSVRLGQLDVVVEVLKSY